MRRIIAADVCEGDLLDLEGDAYFGNHPSFEFEFALVVGVEQETADCVRIDIEGIDSFGVPTYHRLQLVGTMSDDAELQERVRRLLEDQHLQLPDGTRAELIDRTEDGSALVQTAAPIDGYTLVDFHEAEGWARYFVPLADLTIHTNASTGGTQ